MEDNLTAAKLSILAVLSVCLSHISKITKQISQGLRKNALDTALAGCKA